jgi:hypothetical protein
MIGRVLNIINPITETLRPANSALITPLNPANGLPTILPNQSPPHIYSNVAPFTFGSASTVSVTPDCGPPICATVTPVTNPLFGTAINGLQGRVLEFSSPHELLRCYLYWGGDVTTSPPESF